MESPFNPTLLFTQQKSPFSKLSEKLLVLSTCPLSFTTGPTPNSAVSISLYLGTFYLKQRMMAQLPVRQAESNRAIKLLPVTFLS